MADGHITKTLTALRRVVPNARPLIMGPFHSCDLLDAPFAVSAGDTVPHEYRLYPGVITNRCRVIIWGCN